MNIRKINEVSKSGCKRFEVEEEVLKREKVMPFDPKACKPFLLNINGHYKKREDERIEISRNCLSAKKAILLHW